MYRVLIIDDHEFILESLEYGLEGYFNVKTVSDSTQCLEHAKSFNPHVVMVDYRMEGLNGMELTEQLMNHPKPPAVIMISACMNSEVEKQAMDLGVVDCMTKPFDLYDLRNRLHQAAITYVNAS